MLSNHIKSKNMRLCALLASTQIKKASTSMRTLLIPTRRHFCKILHAKSPISFVNLQAIWANKLCEITEALTMSGTRCEQLCEKHCFNVDLIQTSIRESPEMFRIIFPARAEGRQKIFNLHKFVHFSMVRFIFMQSKISEKKLCVSSISLHESRSKSERIYRNT